VLKIDAKNLPPITLTDSDNLQVGDIVLAVGNPFGVGQTVTMGIVSATGRGQFGIVDYEDFIQTDAAINMGNSGGALVDAEGRLVGINTAIIKPDRRQHRPGLCGADQHGAAGDGFLDQRRQGHARLSWHPAQGRDFLLHGPRAETQGTRRRDGR